MAKIQYPAVIAYFGDADSLKHAASSTRERFAKNTMDAYSPYPVHGIEECLGLRRSQVSTVTRFLILTGWGLGFLFQAWTSAVDWATNIGGKPFVSGPAFIPVTFESGILIGGITNLLVMLAVCRLYPRPKTLVLDPTLTDDKFALVVPVRAGDEEAKVVAHLNSLGGKDLIVVEGHDDQTVEYLTRPAILSGRGDTANDAVPAGAH